LDCARAVTGTASMRIASAEASLKENFISILPR
jgi:hypothetical protein